MNDMRIFLDDVEDAIEKRDISERKFENSAGLKIEMQTFEGNNSAMDIYIFRSEFRRWIEPNVQMGLWPDYLKKNCLEGASYNLVAKIENIEDIWGKLFEIYGNTYFMLQKKLSSLEKFSNLEKIKDDEKIAYILTSLLNAMTDLSMSAEDYNLEGELYHGGGIHKILDLMGKQRERTFISKKWNKLATFLENELKEREAYILYEKDA